MMKFKLLAIGLQLTLFSVLMNVTACGLKEQESSELHSESEMLIDGYGSSYFSHISKFVATNMNFNRPLVMNVGLDRQSFLDRGWTQADVGSWNNGSPAGRSGIFLSMFYALQNAHPLDPNHAWNVSVHDFDRGIGAHLDFWTNHRRGERAAVWVYDSLNAPNIAGVVMGATSKEFPFSSGTCGSPNVMACQTGNKIYIKTDFAWALGQRMDAPVRVNGNINLSVVLAHEFGHFLGLGHVDDKNNIMNATIGGVDRIQWQTPAMDAHWQNFGDNLGR